jgi:hypothetical protein
MLSDTSSFSIRLRYICEDDGNHNSRPPRKLLDGFGDEEAFLQVISGPVSASGG